MDDINNNIFNIEFHDHDGELVGKIVIEKDKGMRFSGNLQESANIFFNHLKDKIDEYVLGESQKKSGDCTDCGDRKTI